MTYRSSALKPKAGELWDRPTIVPMPGAVGGVQTPVVSLNGVWKLHAQPPREFWSNAIDPSSWSDVLVPGDTRTQGFDLPADQEYAYRVKLEVPADFAGKRIFLRFDGAGCFTRVWLDGQFVRSHYGGFTSWNCDVTGLATPGESAWLTLGVTDKPREISVFHEGGVLRDVRLVALPADYLSRLHVETDLDETFTHAVLKVTAGAVFTRGQRARLELSLADPNGLPLAIAASTISLDRSQPESSLAISLPNPVKWDAEHPNLYTLEARLVVDGAVLETLQKKFGVRKIETIGKRLYVNGQEVKLRGVNRHDTHPTTGRTVTPQLVDLDVRLFRAANVNFIRTSHYPPREDFLDACDRYGMYVEDEIAVAFVYQSIQPTQNDPDFSPAYLGQFSEMIERDRSHPSVIMWSLANESYWGRNFQAEYDYAKKADSTRPVIFSYPITIPDGVEGFDIWSLHYASWDCDPSARADNFSIGEAWGRDFPVLHDEYAHLPCYDLAEQMRDSGVREFWGESIRRFWESIFTTDGALGGAIWAGIDDTIITSRGYGVWEWGLIDGWRREKPEYWLTKKAYSPIRVNDEPLANPGKGSLLSVPVLNWFDHTNLNEITVRWAVGEEGGVVAGPDATPRAGGQLHIGPRDWQAGETLNLRFYRMGDVLVDEYNLPVGAVEAPPPATPTSAPDLREDQDSITLTGSSFRIVFSKATGLITEGAVKGVQVIKGGPALNLGGVLFPDWSLTSLHAQLDGDQAVVDLRGSYAAVKVHFELRIDGSGLIDAAYTIEELPFHAPRAKRLGVGLDVGGYREVGLAFLLTSAVDRLAWERKGLWSAYPPDHIGRSNGVAYRERSGGDESYGKEPRWPWAEDMRSYPLFGRYDAGGRATKDFTSMKHNIRRAAALLAGTQLGLRAETSAADASVHLELVDNPRVKVDERDPVVRFTGTWTQVDDEPRNYAGSETISNKAGDYAEFTFRGSGVSWIGAKDLIYGIADVYIDGKLEAAGIDLYSHIGLGTARGEEKIYQQVLFSKEGLPEGEHVIRVVVNGKKNPRANNTFVSVDAFTILGSPEKSDVRFCVNNEWNYPELTWGNYVKPPILIEAGYSNSVKVRLVEDK